MTAKKLTNSPTEADLEAEIHRAIARAFPWLSAQSIRHQTKFSFTFGRKKIDVDGAEVSRAEARSDVLLYDGDRPLAVLELKRADVPLTLNDEAQAKAVRCLFLKQPSMSVWFPRIRKRRSR